MSFWRVQFILVREAPTKLILIIQFLKELMFFVTKGRNRMIPYPPIFRRTAARIIDPSIGAST